jgi:putative SOS response-associated peptidase YedK
MGLIPWFSNDDKLSCSNINARADGTRTAASYREPFGKGRRCFVPASRGLPEAGQPKPTLVLSADAQLFKRSASLASLSLRS